MESTLNENEFWLALYKLVNDECAKYGDSTVPLADQMIEMMEIVAQRVEPTAEFYRVRGVAKPEPVEPHPALNMFIIGALLGNLLGWKSGVNFFQLIKEKH